MSPSAEPPLAEIALIVLDAAAAPVVDVGVFSQKMRAASGFVAPEAEISSVRAVVAALATDFAAAASTAQ